MMYKILSVLMMASVATAGNLRNAFSDKFEQWVKDFRINIHDNSHKEHLFVNWVENDKIIDTTNARNLTYTLGHNHLSGMDSNEFSEYMGFQNNANTLGSHISIDKIKVRLAEVKCLKKCIDDYESSNKLSTVTCVTDCLQTRAGLTMNNLPESVDWVKGGAVTPVKNQGQCGSCWSFSATGAIEGANAITNGKLASLSEQELVDCSKRYGNMGCNGGLMDNAFHYVIDNGLCSESDYPYTASDDTCVSTDCTPIVKISDCADVIVNNELALKEAVSKQPVSVAIEADTKTFQLYSSGVLTSDSCGTNLDHGVLVVGYGTEDDTPYWLVKNSWGDTWGEDGYIKIGRSDSESSKGICGIAMQPSYPIV